MSLKGEVSLGSSLMDDPLKEEDVITSRMGCTACVVWISVMDGEET